MERWAIKILLCLLFLFVGTYGYGVLLIKRPDMTDNGMGPTVYPLLLVSLLCVLTVILAISEWVKFGRSRGSVPDNECVNHGREAMATIILVCYVAALPFFEFFWITPLFLGFFSVLYGKPRLIVAVGTAVGGTLVISLLLKCLSGVAMSW